MSDRDTEMQTILAQTTGVSTGTGPVATTATPIWHCCACYEKAMQSDRDDHAQVASANRITAALRIIETDVGRVSSELREKAEAFLERTLSSGNLPRL
jgi:hypothetical protein